MPTLRFLGHSACEVRAGGASLLIDPFLSGNPLAAAKPEEFDPAAILLTHAHNDHVGDTAEIARRTGAPIVGNHEVATFFERQGLKAHGMNHGGAYRFPWGRVKFTPAWHSSTYLDENGFHTLGLPAGILLEVEGKTLFHAGDTCLFSDMALIGRAGIDLALLPIGDNYTMGPDDAVEAVQLLKPRLVVPVHYNTFPVIEQDGPAFGQRVERETDARCLVLEPGQTAEF